MPAWLVPLLAKLGVDLVEVAINFLEKHGVISAGQAAIARIVHRTKTYYQRGDFPSPPPVPPESGTNTNMTVGNPPDDGFPKQVKSGL